MKFTLEEIEPSGSVLIRWRLSSQHTGEIRECTTAQVLLACIFGDLANKVGVVAVAEWLTEQVAEMDATIVDAEL